MSKAAIIRGNLTSKITVLTVGDKLTLVRNSFAKSACNTRTGEMLYLPTPKETKNNITFSATRRTTTKEKGKFFL